MRRRKKIASSNGERDRKRANLAVCVCSAVFCPTKETKIQGGGGGSDPQARGSHFSIVTMLKTQPGEPENYQQTFRFVPIEDENKVISQVLKITVFECKWICISEKRTHVCVHRYF